MQPILLPRAYVSTSSLLLTSNVLFAGVVYDPVEWRTADGGNGHRYRAVFASERLSWTDAKAMAEALGGHLATLTSAAEAQFVFTSVARSEQWWIDGGPWLGGFQDPSAPGYSEPSGGWRWVTGEAWTYTNWGSGEPNNYGGTEMYLHYLDAGGSPVPYWNDQSNGRTQRGFIMEYAVPAPGALAMLALGTLKGFRRRSDQVRI
jgi:hypothetical protein